MKHLILSLGVTMCFLVSAEKAQAHCEIPCGIYEDSLRIALIMEHITTIEKSMNKIKEESAKATPNWNQLVRWVSNKEEHAKKIQDIVSQYFLHQRIKLTDPEDMVKYAKYQKHLGLLHQVLVYSMKAKQTTDQMYIDKLRKAVSGFEKAYFHKHG
ncbi:MAG: superoxide dismutase [Ni] [Saprospiraceae bacterium]